MAKKSIFSVAGIALAMTACGNDNGVSSHGYDEIDNGKSSSGGSSVTWEFIDESSSSAKPSSSSKKQDIEVTPSSSSAKPSSSSKASEEGKLCKIGNTVITRFVSPYFDQDFEVGKSGEMYSDNCEVGGKYGVTYFTEPDKDEITPRTNVTEEVLCGSIGVWGAVVDADPLEYWKIKASNNLCNQWRNEGRIQ